MLIVFTLKLFLNKQYDLRDLVIDIFTALAINYVNNIVNFIVSIFAIAIFINHLFNNMYIKNRILIKRK